MQIISSETKTLPGQEVFFDVQVLVYYEFIPEG
jgi:hypothetical protein